MKYRIVYDSFETRINECEDTAQGEDVFNTFEEAAAVVSDYLRTLIVGAMGQYFWVNPTGFGEFVQSDEFKSACNPPPHEDIEPPTVDFELLSKVEAQLGIPKAGESDFRRSIATFVGTFIVTNSSAFKYYSNAQLHSAFKAISGDDEAAMSKLCGDYITNAVAFCQTEK